MRKRRLHPLYLSFSSSALRISRCIEIIKAASKLFLFKYTYARVPGFLLFYTGVRLDTELSTASRK